MKLTEIQHRQESVTPFQYVVCSETNRRENNEDSFHIYDIFLPAIRQSLKVLSVADGMGGHACGEDVSSEALRKVSIALFEQLCIAPALNSLKREEPVENESVAQALRSAVEQANAFVLRMIRANNWGKAGSTIVIAAILGNTAVVVNLGDSPVFHYQKSTRRMRKVTDDHTVAGSLLRDGKITPEMAVHHEGRSRLKWYIGSEKLPETIPTKSIELATGDLLLLCTDGVTGILLNQTIQKILSDSTGDLKVIAQQLIKTARESGETDNQTLILWRHSMVSTAQREEIPIEKGKGKAIEERLAALEGQVALQGKRLEVLEEKRAHDQTGQEIAENGKREAEDQQPAEETQRAVQEEWIEVKIKSDFGKTVKRERKKTSEDDEKAGQNKENISTDDKKNGDKAEVGENETASGIMEISQKDENIVEDEKDISVPADENTTIDDTKIETEEFQKVSELREISQEDGKTVEGEKDISVPADKSTTIDDTKIETEDNDTLRKETEDKEITKKGTAETEARTVQRKKQGQTTVQRKRQ